MRLIELFNTGVVPVLDYCSGVWGYEKFDKISTGQNWSIG